MKRREFLGAPVALLGLGLVAGYSPLAAAAKLTVPARFVLLRLAGSGGESEITGLWQDAWPQLDASLDQARVQMLGVVRATKSTLGAVDIESAFFGSRNEINVALTYRAADGKDSGSRPMSFLAQAPHFAGFVVTQTGLGGGRGSAPSVTAIGDGRDGRLVPGHYVMLHLPDSAGRFSVNDYRYSGRLLAPLQRRDGRAVAADYIVFAVDPA
jgi:hypothetical protein